MNLLYIGSGFVGTCSAAVSADSGHQVLVYDINQDKINLLASGDREKIKNCIFEEGLSDLLIRNQERIKFTFDYEQVEQFLESGEAIFMCLPTPEIGESGESDLSFYFSAAEKLATSLTKRNNGQQENHLIIINKSTVPIDMVEHTREIMSKAGVKNYGIVSNPEFLAEGKAVQGSLKPDRVVVGAEVETDFLVMRKIYERFYDSPSVQYIEVNPKEAAAGKLLANFYLFNKLAVCFDVIGRTCETFTDLHFENIRRILSADPRIGGWGMYDSLFAGGSCFIKDARSLAHQLRTAGQEATLVEETYLANIRQLELFIGRAEKEAGFDWTGKTIALLGLAFKRDTNDIRNSASVYLMNFFRQKQVKEIRCYDQTAEDNFKKSFPESEIIKYFNHEFEAVKTAEVVVIATDWPQFRGLADVMIAELTTRPLIMDGRRMLQHRYADLDKAGFKVIAVGSKTVV